MADLALFDLDGVVRRWDGSRLTAIERSHALPPGSLLATAFAPVPFQRAITGRVTDEVWRAEVATSLSETFGCDGVGAVAAWSESSGEVVTEVVSIVREVRRAVPVGLVTNATTRLRVDLERLGLADEFDFIFNSSELRVAKPDPAIFRLVCSEAGVEAATCVFIDDSSEHVGAARDVGLVAHVFEGPERLRETLVHEGLLAQRR